MTERLRFHQLSVRRGDRLVVRDQGGVVASGQALHIAGPNGVGKTSLLETLAGLRAPAEGMVYRAGDARPHWIGHRNGLDPAFSVRENLESWCALEGADAARIGPALESVGLRPVAERAARTLSAGQRRRAALSRLGLADRSVWLLDEPLAALDAAGGERLGRLLDAHLAGGGAVIFSSHQPIRLARVVADTLTLS